MGDSIDTMDTVDTVDTVLDTVNTVHTGNTNPMSVRFSENNEVRNITPRKVFMPEISALLCHNSPLQQYSPVSSWNKSRNVNRRHLSITSMQNDIDNLKKYLGAQMKLKGLRTDEGDFKACCGKKSAKFCALFFNLLACLICFPCVLISKCTRLIKCRKPKINILKSKEGNVTIMEDFDYFWDPIDIRDEEYHQYQLSVKAVLLDWLRTKNPESWDKIDKELAEICINDYSNRLRVWLDMYQTEGVDMQRDMAGQGLKMMQLSYTNGSNDVIHKLIENGHSIVGLRKFTMGLYKGTSPLHLAIINESLNATSNILSCSDSYELMHLRAVNTPLQEIFPTIELPLNLAVWMGDANIVAALIDKGAEMCTTDQDGNNAIHVAALLAEEDPNKSVQMLDVLLDQIDSWLEHTTECKALLDLSLKKARLVALNMLFKCTNKQGLTPLKLAAKSGCAPLVQKILNIDKLYRFPLYKLGPKSESLYDYSEIDPLLSHGKDTVSVLEILIHDENDRTINILGLPQITALRDTKTKRLNTPVAILIIFHLLFMTLHSVAFYIYLLPKMMPTTDGTTQADRYTMWSTDIVILLIGCIYMLFFVVGATSCVQMSRRSRLSVKNLTYVVATMQLPTILGFSVSLIMYFILKALENDYEIFMLSLSMLCGWIHCIYFTRLFKSTGFFALMLHRVMYEDILRFLSIIGIMVLSFTMMTSALLTTDSAMQEPDENVLQPTGPIPIAFDFFQLASGITDFTLLQRSSYWFISGLIYITFLVLANILMFNLLIASMSNRYAIISGNGELLCTRVTLEDILMWEWMMPKGLRVGAQSIYEHRIVRVSLSTSHYVENHVYLLRAPDPDTSTIHWRHARQMSTVHL